MIEFFDKNYWWLNNSSPYKIKNDGLVFQTVWNAFVAAKTTDYAIKRELAETAVQHINSVEKRVIQHANFDAVGTMQLLLEKKFGLVAGLDPVDAMKLGKRLIQTGGDTIEFGNYECATYWGKCRCSKHVWGNGSIQKGTGTNMLGQLLMRTRTNWRDYIEEVNVIDNTCGDCGNPVAIRLLTTARVNPTFPVIVASC